MKIHNKYKNKCDFPCITMACKCHHKNEKKGGVNYGRNIYRKEEGICTSSYQRRWDKSETSLS